MCVFILFIFSSRRRHTSCALVTGVQTCALPIFNAIRVIVPHDTSVLERYEVHAVTGGTDAQAEVSVLLSEDGRTVRGRGAHVDTMVARSEEHTSELQSLMRISYAVFCLKKKKRTNKRTLNNTTTNNVHRTK